MCTACNADPGATAHNSVASVCRPCHPLAQPSTAVDFFIAWENHASEVGPFERMADFIGHLGTTFLAPPVWRSPCAPRQCSQLQSSVLETCVCRGGVGRRVEHSMQVWEVLDVLAIQCSGFLIRSSLAIRKWSGLINQLGRPLRTQNYVADGDGHSGEVFVSVAETPTEPHCQHRKSKLPSLGLLFTWRLQITCLCSLGVL